MHKVVRLKNLDFSLNEHAKNLTLFTVNSLGDTVAYAFAARDENSFYIRIISAHSEPKESSNFEEPIQCLTFTEVGNRSMLFVGFADGTIRVLDVNCLQVFEQFIHPEPVKKIKFTSKSRTRKIGHMTAVFESILVHITSSNLVETLLKGHDDLEVSVWKPFKISISDVEEVYDVVSVAPIAYLRDRICELTLEPLNPESYSPQHKLFLIVVGRNPCITYVEIEEDSQRFSMREYGKKLAGELLTSAFGMVGSFFQPSSSRNNKTAIIEKLAKETPDEYRGRSHIRDPTRLIHQVESSPCGRFLAFTDSYGRVLVMEVETFSLIHFFKGYRDATCAWLTASISEQFGRKQAFLFIYLPMRGLLEFYRVGTRERFGAMNVGMDCKLVHQKDSKGVSRAFLIRRDGAMQKIVISADYCTCPSSFAPALKSETMTYIRQLRTLLGEWQARGTEIMDVFLSVKSATELDNCITVCLKHDVDPSDTVVFCERLCKFIRRASEKVAKLPNKPSVTAYDKTIRLLQAYSIRAMCAEAKEPVPLQIPPVNTLSKAEPPTLSLEKFVNFFLSPPEDLLTGAQFIFDRVFMDTSVGDSSDATTGFPALMLEKMNLPHDFVTKLFLTWFSHLRAEMFQTVHSFQDLPHPIQTQIRSPKGLDWTDPIFEMFLTDALTQFEQKIAPTAEFLLMQSAHFATDVREWALASTKMSHVFLLSRICDAIVNKNRSTDENFWVILVSRSFKLRIAQMLLPLESFKIEDFHIDWCLARHASLCLLRETQVYRDDRLEFTSKIKEILLQLHDAESIVEESYLKKKENKNSLAERLCLLSRTSLGHISSSNVGFYTLHSMMENMYDLQGSALSELGLELVYFHTLAEAVWDPEELESYGLCIRLYERIICVHINSILQQKVKVNSDSVKPLLKYSVSILKLLESMTTQILEINDQKAMEAKQKETKLRENISIQEAAKSGFGEEQDDDEMTKWPPRETHEKYVAQFRRMALNCLGKPILVNAVKLTLKRYIEILRLLFVWFKSDLPFYEDGLTVTKAGSKMSQNVAFSELFPSFRRFEPDVFSVLRLQEAHVNFESANSPVRLRKDVVMAVARKDVRLALDLAHDFQLDIDDCRKEITLCLFQLGKDKFATRMLESVEDQVGISQLMLEVAKDRIANELCIAMNSPEKQEVISQIPADLVQNLVSRTPPEKKVKKMSEKQFHFTIELCSRVDRIFRENDLPARLKRQPEQLVRIVRLLMGIEMISVGWD